MRLKSNVYTQAIGLLLIIAGALGDIAAGLALLEHHTWPGLALHVPSALVWVAGFVLLGRDRGAGPGSGVGRGEPIVAILLGLVLFPGLGTVGGLLALGAARLVGRPRPFEREAPDGAGARDPGPAIDFDSSLPLHPLVELETQPLAEALRKPHTQVKCAMLELICREPGPRAITLARSMLAEPDPEVRALAAVAVSRLEAHFADQLKQAVQRRDREPQLAGRHSALGHLYEQYARQGTADPATRRQYLLQARQAFEQASALDPARQDWLQPMAEVLLLLGENEEAWAAITRLLSARRSDSGGYRVALEIALSQRRIDRMADLVAAAGAALDESDTLRPGLNWWLEALPASGDRTS
jgi:hypothetical protein